MSVPELAATLDRDRPTLEPLEGPVVPARAPSRVLRATLLGSDAAALLTAWLLVRPSTGGPLHLGATALWVVGGMLVLGAFHLYRARVSSAWTNETARLLRATMFLTLLWTAVAGFRSEVATAVIPLAGWTAVLLIVTRGVYRSVLRRLRERGDLTTSVIVVGQAEEAADLVELIETTPEAGFSIAGVVGPRTGWRSHDLPWLGDLHQAVEAVEAGSADGVVVETAGLAADVASHLVHTLLEQGARVQVSIGLRDFDHRRLTPRPIGHAPLMYLEPPRLSPWQRTAKRALDVVGAAAGLVLSLPLLVPAAIGIRLHDGGPALFRQVRVGRDGEPFTMWKLRTMTMDADHQRSRLGAGNRRDGPLFKMADDPRVTPFGRLLRATSIDEIPQFWNVLRGEMSLVGPRPALPEEVANFDHELVRRLDVRPGVTGLWQVEARDKPSFSLYRRLDLYYVRNWSIDLDLAILLATVGTVLARSLRAARRALRRGSKPTSEPVLE